MSYDAVKRELTAGTPAELICATCPWDRLCVKPPAMTEHEVKAQIDAAETADRERDPSGKGMPMGALMTALTLSGRASSGEMCPIFAARLRSPDGRGLADTMRSSMQNWGAS